MVGKRIKAYILKAGLKFNAIAKKAGIPCNTFSTMLNGKRKITIEEYFSICDALGISVETFKLERTA